MNMGLFVDRLVKNQLFQICDKMHSSAKPFCIFLSCDKVYHKQEVRFLLYLLGEIVT